MLPLEVSGLSIASLYVCANLLLAAAAVSLAGIQALSARVGRRLTYRQMLLIGRVLTVAALLLSSVTIWRGGNDLSPLRAQVWSAPSMYASATSTRDAARIEVSVDSQHAFLPLRLTEDAALLLLTVGLLASLWPVVTEAIATIHALRNSHETRRIGRVRILISDEQQVPFALWIPGQSLIILPAELLLRLGDFRLALRHEVQHHRQGDTRCLYALLFIRALFGLNPAVHWLVRQLLELQEFACDEALSRYRGHSAREYCTCLLRVAEKALPARHTPLRSFMAGHRPFALARRVEAVLQPAAHPIAARAAVGIGAIAIALLTSLTAVLATPIHDRRLSRSEAVRLASDAQRGSTIPLVVNDAVLRQLNLLLGTADGRAFLRSSIGRMRPYKARILAALRAHRLPAELVAVPLVESGYRDWAPPRGLGAGLWMFIAPTARNYGLEVSKRKDERLDVRAETHAALHMLSDLEHRFDSWPLALMAYNSGVAQVEAGIRATHSRDAWTLYRAGFGNDPVYLARTVAVILILAHPRLLD